MQDEFILDALAILTSFESSVYNLYGSLEPKTELTYLRRLLHTLKGNSQIAGFPDLARVVHVVEDCLSAVDESREVHPDILESLIKAHRSLEEKLLGIREGSRELWETTTLVEELKRLSLSTSTTPTQVDRRTLAYFEAKPRAQELVTWDGFFDECRRLVENLGQELGKKIDFQIQGAEVEVPQYLKEYLSISIIQLLKNAADHGCGHKGRISLSAQPIQDGVMLKVQDHGDGINRKLIFKKAHQKALIAASVKEADLHDDELLSLIFLPGFSVKEYAGLVSGRGIGLDIVKAQVDELGGKLKVKSTDQGTTFFLSVPFKRTKKSGKAA